MSEIVPKQIGFIFDLDGTLLDSTNLISQIPEKLAQKYNVSLDEKSAIEIEEKIVSTLKGKSSKFLVLGLIFFVAKKYGVPWYLRIQYAIDAGKIYKTLIRTVAIISGVRETLDFLIQKRIRIAINTTASKKEVLDRFEKRMELLELFEDFVITRSDVERLKPHPESINILSNQMDIPIPNLVMVGDMDSDIQAGQNAGCTTIGVLSGYATKEMMEKYNPDFIIDSVKDLPLIFSSLVKKIHSQ